MTVNEIMVLFKDPDTIKSLSANERLLGVGFTLILGMGITFVSLILLNFIMVALSNFLKEKEPENIVQKTVDTTEVIDEPLEEVYDDKAVIAAITVALAAKLNTSIHNIRIKNIKKVEKTHIPWKQVGIIEQMNNRL